MCADRPKQYLKINGTTVLEHTVNKLLSHRLIAKVVIAISEGDEHFTKLDLVRNPDVIRVIGGSERADSVLSALRYVANNFSTEWVIVHDAARPCFQLDDVDALIDVSLKNHIGGILASPVTDTIKRGDTSGLIEHTIDRRDMWHAFTPQMFKVKLLFNALLDALDSGVSITDEASALEWTGAKPELVKGQTSNIKITQPEDLALAAFYISQDKG
jgi:2-C-methyl-D-erythritol 4-phosphate cytidylyltransferase